MIQRLTIMMIEIALLISGAAAVIYSIRLAVGQVLPVGWFWGGAIAIFFAPVALAGALRLLDPQRAR
jgi:xanthine/uracil permease